MYLDATPSVAHADGTTADPFVTSLTTLAAMLAVRGAAATDGPALPADLADVLRRLRDEVPGTRAASVLATNPALRGAAATVPATVAATGELAERADQCQLAAGAGPSLEACRQPVQAGPDELRGEWPDLAEPLAQLGVAAVLALPLPGLAGRGALTFYGEAPFPVDALAPAAEAAAVAAVALAALETRDRAANLEIALASSRQISAAVGIVMAQDRCSYDEAFQRIRSISQRTHRKMRELADQIVFTGARPPEGD
jgi:hypothetical protein